MKKEITKIATDAEKQMQKTIKKITDYLKKEKKLLILFSIFFFIKYLFSSDDKKSDSEE